MGDWPKSPGRVEAALANALRDCARLRGENARLREALKPFVDDVETVPADPDDTVVHLVWGGVRHGYVNGSVTAGDLRRACTALEGDAHDYAD